MRVNVYAQELPDERRVEQVKKQTESGNVYYGVRIFLKSPEELHDTLEDDDRSAVTFWGPPGKVSDLLREAAEEMESLDE